MPKRTESPNRLRFTRGLLIGLFAVAAFSQARVQLFARAEIIEKAKETGRYTLTRGEKAQRGAILTVDGKPLALDDDRFELGVKFSQVPHSDAFYIDLAAASGLSATDLSQIAAREPRGVKTWRERLSSAEADAVRAVKTKWRAGGIWLESKGERAYPLGEAASGVVGRFRGGRPEGGLEAGLDEVLAGKDGETVGLPDRSGAFLPMRIDPKSVPRIDGLSVVSTLDSVLQQTAAAAIKTAVESNQADQGVAIALDPKTGDILAMANWPTFDPNNTPGATLKNEVVDFNPNYMGAFEPGSTFKILTLAKAMDEGKVRDEETLYCGGSLVVWGDRRIHCDLHHGSRAHGSITPALGIAKSCNVAAATWAALIGRDTFIDFLEELGLLDKQGLGLPGERSGSIFRDEYATGLQLANFGFGQSITATPVGLASAFAMLANDGVRMVPRLVKKVGGVEQEPRPAGAVVRPETAHQILRYMESVVESDAGTGKSLRIPGYRLAGKTGTAQRKNSGNGYVSNFVGFVPAEAPRAMILVMVDNPKAGQYYGASVAGPVFDELARAVIRRYGIPPAPQPKRGEGAPAGAQRVPPSP